MSTEKINKFIYFYLIESKDKNINDKYIGQTINFKVRKNAHIYQSQTSDIRLYKHIRENGGFDNWDIKIIYSYDCENENVAKQIEQILINFYKANLNTNNPWICKLDKKLNEKVIYGIKNSILGVFCYDFIYDYDEEESNYEHQYECIFCKSCLGSMNSLNYHMQSNKKCLLIQQEIKSDKVINKLMECEFCKKEFSSCNYIKHIKICKIKKKIEQEQTENKLKKRIKELEEKIIEFESESQNIQSESIYKILNYMEVKERKMQEQIYHLQNEKSELELKLIKYNNTLYNLFMTKCEEEDDKKLLNFITYVRKSQLLPSDFDFSMSKHTYFEIYFSKFIERKAVDNKIYNLNLFKINILNKANEIFKLVKPYIEKRKNFLNDIDLVSKITSLKKDIDIFLGEKKKLENQGIEVHEDIIIKYCISLIDIIYVDVPQMNKKT